MSLCNFVFFTVEQLTRIARGSKGRAKKPSGSGGGGGGGGRGQGPHLGNIFGPALSEAF